ncbi:hydroxypyruvate isomerase family protein [Bounagaea algeriensis]
MDRSRFDVNLSVLFTELDLLDRPAAAKAAGFDAIEFWWPFPDPVPSEREVDRFVHAVEDAGVSLVGLNFFAGDMPAGDRGVLSQPARAHEFRDNIDITVDIGKRLGCRAFNALYGNRVEGVDPAEQDAVATESLVSAAKAAAEIDGTVLVEPVSGTPAYPLHTAGDAVAAIERARARDVHNVGLLLDIYHLVANGDDPSRAVRDHGRHIGHVQIADAPGRNEPGTGSIDFSRHFRELDDLGYTGHIGLEYKPSAATTDSFNWIQ